MSDRVKLLHNEHNSSLLEKEIEKMLDEVCRSTNDVNLLDQDNLRFGGFGVSRLLPKWIFDTAGKDNSGEKGGTEIFPSTAAFLLSPTAVCIGHNGTAQYIIKRDPFKESR